MAATKPDKRTIVKDILEKGKAAGKLTTKEIFDIMGETDFDPEQLERMYDQLEKEGVEVVEDLVDDISDIEINKIEKSNEGDDTGEGQAAADAAIADNIAVAVVRGGNRAGSQNKKRRCCRKEKTVRG